MTLLPTYKNDQVKDGLLLACLSFCSKRRDDCHKFYQNLDCGRFQQCPYGFYSYKSSSNTIYTSLYIAELCKSNFVRNKLLASEKMIKFKQSDYLRLIDSSETQIRQASKIVELAEYINQTLHETKNLNAQIIHHSQHMSYVLNKKLVDSSYMVNFKEMEGYATNCYAISQLISLRYEMYQALDNPEGLSLGQKQNRNIFKIFDKIRMCLGSRAAEKHMRIDMNEYTPSRTPRVYDSFELVPFIIIDNAIKYSPQRGNVNIYFFEATDKLVVTIESTGPSVSNDELALLFTKGFRGRLAKESKIAGSGLGLFLAKKVCEVNGIEISISAYDNVKVKERGLQCIFTVVLSIPL